MFGFLLDASVMPCQDDWLNERSSTPPVSRTMQALYAALVAEAVGVPDVGLATGDDDAGVLFEPQATSASAATPKTAADLRCFFTRSSSAGTQPFAQRTPVPYICREETITGVSGEFHIPL